MTATPPYVTLDKIIKDLFQNEFLCHEVTEIYTIFSHVKLSDEQVSQLTYNDGFKPLDVYLIQQTDRYNVDRLNASDVSLVSFVKKDNDPHIYGVYFDLKGQKRFKKDRLINTCHGLHLDKDVQITPENYLELYIRVGCTTVIHGISDDTFKDNSLQFRKGRHYYYQTLELTGIADPKIPATKVLGLSYNLEKFTCH